MDEKGFRDFCHAGKRVLKGLPEKTITANLRFVKEFEKFLAKRKKKDFRYATAKDMTDFSDLMIRQGKNKFENYVALVRYARFINNKDAELALLKSVDGGEVLGVLGDTIKKTKGKAARDEVFRGITLPVMGASSEGWPEIAKVFIERLKKGLGQGEARDVLLTGPHAAPAKYFAEDRKKYLDSKNLDEYLKLRHAEALDLLRTHMREDTFFYDQEIDEDVLRFVEGHQEVLGGVRKGGIIYETKIPYRTKEYLREKDKTMKRYYACHCPWVRESILSGPAISPDFCYCSAGYHKRPWDVVFSEPVRVEVLESVLQGDMVCRFAIHVPEKAMPPSKKKKRAKKRRETGK
jgi:hypothetical protein